MRKIVDSNYLNCPELEEYLSSNQQNYVVLCEYVAIEAYKSKSPLDGICDSMELLSKYPEQIVVLKNTSEILGLDFIESGFQERMIEHETTKDFPNFCKHILEAKAGNEQFANQILEHGGVVVAFANSLVSGVADIRSAIIELAKEFTPAELAVLRKNTKWPLSLKKKFEIQFHGLVRGAYLGGRQPVAGITFSALHLHFMYRYMLCCYILILRWIASGYPPKNPEKLRNHMFDCIFAAYATYFDGFLSGDIEANTTYEAAAAFLSVR